LKLAALAPVIDWMMANLMEALVTPSTGAQLAVLVTAVTLGAGFGAAVALLVANMTTVAALSAPMARVFDRLLLSEILIDFPPFVQPGAAPNR